MIFTILTFRALGRTHIASEPCVAIAMLCFDSTVGFPWSVPVLKQQLDAERGRAAAQLVRPPPRPPWKCPPGCPEAPARDRPLRAAGGAHRGRAAAGACFLTGSARGGSPEGAPTPLLTPRLPQPDRAPRDDPRLDHRPRDLPSALNPLCPVTGGPFHRPFRDRTWAG